MTPNSFTLCSNCEAQHLRPTVCVLGKGKHHIIEQGLHGSTRLACSVEGTYVFSAGETQSQRLKGRPCVLGRGGGVNKGSEISSMKALLSNNLERSHNI